MKKICFLMPIYPPHFERAKRFSESFFDFSLNKQADLAFVFTNEDEANEFKNTAFYPYKEIILDKKLQENEDKGSGIINIKKFYGLQQIQNDYLYTIVLDAESIIIKNINLMKMCKEFENKKILYGNENLNDDNWIYSECMKFFTSVEQNNIDNNLYLWFNQPCIYINSNLKDFFNKTDLNNLYQRKSEISVGAFDYYIYMYYLILFHNYKIKDLNIVSPYAFLEDRNFVTQSNQYKKIKFFWSSFETYDFINQKNIFILMHIDRGRDFIMKKFGLHSALSRIKNHLSYKFGKCIVEHSIFMLPFYLFKILKEHKKNQKLIKYIIFEELPNLNQYPDYCKALKIMEQQYYKIGSKFLSSRGGVSKIIYILKIKFKGLK